STVSMALQKGQRLREAGQFEVAAVGQIKSAGDTGSLGGEVEVRLTVFTHGLGAFRTNPCRPSSWMQSSYGTSRHYGATRTPV
ncbi:hypothetical protein, partial [Xanthomonas phaseoli]|uniref:hypothetical protein n=1 Tax=Xanthomonas phaseoli TaxID=1985254 RepID=UPI001EE66EF7